MVVVVAVVVVVVVVLGLVGLPPPQPTRETTLRARTRAARVRFIKVLLGKCGHNTEIVRDSP